MIYFIADIYFNHENIIKYCDSSFKILEEMNGSLINNWNSIVDKDDIVYHLGDFTIDYDNLDKLVNKLNGKMLNIISKMIAKNIYSFFFWTYRKKVWLRSDF